MPGKKPEPDKDKKITVLIKTESHYTINRQRVRRVIEQFLKEASVKGSVEVSLSIVGDRMMRLLNRKYRQIDETTDVLAFPLSLGNGNKPFVFSPDGVLRLGDIVISYPQAREGAIEEEKLMDEKIDELIIHGMRHLMGQNYE